MTLQLRKKHRITRPSSSRPIGVEKQVAKRNARGAGWLTPAALAFCSLLLVSSGTARSAEDYQLSGNRLRRASRQSAQYAQHNSRSSYVTPIVWEEEPAGRDSQLASSGTESTSRTFSERSIRIAAQDDPFDEPMIEEPEIDPIPNPEQAEEAIDREIERRAMERENEAIDPQIDSDPFEDDSTDTEQIMTAPQDDQSQPKVISPLEVKSPDSRETDRTEDRANEFAPGTTDYYDDGIAVDSDLQKKQLANEIAENEKSCQEEYQQLASAGIDTIDLNIQVEGNPGVDFPYECGLGVSRFQPRKWPQITYMWKASGLYHRPLYFEQIQLERYGHSCGPYIQPLVSGAHFFATLPILPYKMGLKTPNECVYSLGYYRPGSCAPYMIDPVPFTWRAALFEAGAVVGAAAAIP